MPIHIIDDVEQHKEPLKIGLTAEALERLKGASVIVGSPIARDPTRLYGKSMWDTQDMFRQIGVHLSWYVNSGCSDLAYARNLIAGYFVDSAHTDLFWIDDDICWNPASMLRLLISPHDYIAVPYRKKLTEHELWTVERLEETPEPDELGAIQVATTGLGFTRMTKRVFTDMMQAYPELRFDRPREPHEPKTLYRFFSFHGDGTTEDVRFCQMYRKIGGTIWADPNNKIGHVGEYIYAGDFKPA